MTYLIVPATLLYAIASMLLLLYGINCYIMIYFSLLKKRSEDIKVDPDIDLPTVTIQLPIYNERNVSERVIRAAASLDYPIDKLEIQVLDDSNDETVSIVDRVVEELRGKGIDINAIRRPDRQGFKAGALAYGISSAKGEFLAVFDSDFVPGSDFLRRTIPVFMRDSKAAFVQTRWGHLNRRESVLTRCQALGIDGHFLVEQPARSKGGLFMNFNGTAGIWRKAAIVDAGGWSDATLTEDLDLSYRVQLAGWKPYYMSDVIVPAELPLTMAALKNQQFRWAKGSMQTALLVLPRVWRGPYSFLKKTEAFLHLTNYVVHPMMLVMALLALPMLLFGLVRIPPWVFTIASLPLLVSTFGPSSMYIVAMARLSERRIGSFLWMPVLVVYGTGIAVSNSVAIFEAIAGKTSSFVRTPKKGESRSSGYRLGKNKIWAFEVLLGAYSICSVAAAVVSGNYGILPFLAIFAVGFLTVGIRTAVGSTRDA